MVKPTNVFLFATVLFALSSGYNHYRQEKQLRELNYQSQYHYHRNDGHDHNVRNVENWWGKYWRSSVPNWEDFDRTNQF
jgi:hypothetical protein